MTTSTQIKALFSLVTVLMVFVLASTPAKADLADGLVEYWKLDDNFNAEVDATHVGTLLTSGVGSSGTFVPGKFGSAIDLESGQDSIDPDPKVYHSASIVIGGDEDDFDFAEDGVQDAMSLSIWYTTESLYRDWQTLAGKGEGGSWRLARNRTTASQLKISLWLVGEGKLDQQDGSWHHAVVALDQTGHKLYVDGELSASNENPVNLGNNNEPMQIGGNPQAGDRGWDGNIDDVAIWDRALTADEVSAIWNDGNGATIESLTSTSPIPGDMNNDNAVNETDVQLFTAFYGTNGTSTFSTGDFDDDQKTGLTDLLLLKQNFGIVVDAPVAVAVPEPSTLILCVMGILGLGFYRRVSKVSKSE